MPTLTKTRKPKTKQAIIKQAITKQDQAKKTSPASALSLLQSPGLKRIPWLVHGFSTRPGGASTVYGGRTLNLGFTKDDDREHVE
ncbi:MAG TPA: hypothetical protein VHA06_23035, partial [Candidatus Angelobacter sp.]|nr:hypothetical protein [Candidatus Angelobacter sp.]